MTADISAVVLRAAASLVKVRNLHSSVFLAENMRPNWPKTPPLCVWATVMSGVLPAGDSDVTVLVDVAGTLPPQLQGHRGQVTSRGLHHYFPHGAAARVEDVVEPEPQQLLGLWHATCHHRVQILQVKTIKVLFIIFLFHFLTYNYV